MIKSQISDEMNEEATYNQNLCENTYVVAIAMS